VEITDPKDINVSNDIGLLLAEVDEAVGEFAALGDFSADVLDQMRREFLPQRLSDTLNIEGVGVNPRITRAILEGLTLAESDRYNDQEVINAIRANDFMEGHAREGAELTPRYVREVQGLVTDGLLRTPGAYRETQVEITGASITPPPPVEVPRLVQELCDLSVEHGAGMHPVVLATWVHQSFGAIHPFPDGNGRTGRLLQDWILVKHGHLPVGIPASRRAEYYEALQSADEGDYMPLVGIVANSELTALERATRIAQAPNLRMQRIRDLARRSQLTVQQREYKQYEVWRRRSEGIREEFQRWARELSSELPDLQVRVKVWDPISFDKWQEIRERGQTKGTWMFTLVFTVRKTPIFSWLFYARRHELAYTFDYEPMETFHGLVGIFATGDHEPNPHWDFGQFSDAYVSLRELLYVSDELYAYHEQSSDDLAASHEADGLAVHLLSEPKWVSSKDVAVGDEVERFFEQSLLKFGLIDQG